MLQTKNLNLHYPGKLLCRDLNLTVNPGECWAILGQNGCGKTTLIHALSNLCHGGGGSVTVAGKVLQDWPRRDLARKLGIMLQEEPGEFWGNVLEYVLLGRYPHAGNPFGWEGGGQSTALQAIDRLELTALAQRPMATLSGGERQRARIALLLTQSPDCYLLDEPLQHLDLRHQLLTMTLFSELALQGSAVMMVLHDLTWVNPYCDHVLMLFDNGRSLAGPTEEVFSRSNLEALYQCNLEESGLGSTRHFMPALEAGV